MPLIVVLDTNILTVPAQFGVDIFAESERVLERNIEFVVLDSVVGELEKKLEDAVRTERYKFRVALDLVERCSRIQSGSEVRLVDDQVLDYADKTNGVIATNDRNLRERALEQGIAVLFLRGKKKLELHGIIR